MAFAALEEYHTGVEPLRSALQNMGPAMMIVVYYLYYGSAWESSYGPGPSCARGCTDTEQKDGTVFKELTISWKFL